MLREGAQGPGGAGPWTGCPTRRPTLTGGWLLSVLRAASPIARVQAQGEEDWTFPPPRLASGETDVNATGVSPPESAGVCLSHWPSWELGAAMVGTRGHRWRVWREQKGEPGALLHYVVCLGLLGFILQANLKPKRGN